MPLQINSAIWGLYFLPLVIAGVGIVASIIGTFFVGIKNNEAKEKQDTKLAKHW